MPKRAEKMRQFNLQWMKESWAEGIFCNIDIVKIYFGSFPRIYKFLLFRLVN